MLKGAVERNLRRDLGGGLRVGRGPVELVRRVRPILAEITAKAIMNAVVQALCLRRLLSQRQPQCRQWEEFKVMSG